MINVSTIFMIRPVMNPSRYYTLPLVVRWNEVRYLSSSSHQYRNSTVRNSRLRLLTQIPYPQQRTARRTLQQQHIFNASSSSSSTTTTTNHKSQQDPITSTTTPSLTSISAERSGSCKHDASSVLPGTTIATAAIAAKTTVGTAAAAGEESMLKEPSSSTTTTNNTTNTTTTKKQEKFTSSEQKPRPIFPWRHDITPIPRLVPGTKEFEEARTALYHSSNWVSWNERLTASLFLGVPISTILLSFQRWKQSLAYDGMYAFTKGVAGIVSNTYRIPVDKVSSEVKNLDIISFFEIHDDHDNDDDTTPMVHFNYPPSDNDDDDDQTDPAIANKEFNDEIMSILNQVFNMDHEKKDPTENSEAKSEVMPQSTSSNPSTSNTVPTQNTTSTPLDDPIKDTSLNPNFKDQSSRSESTEKMTNGDAVVLSTSAPDKSVPTDNNNNNNNSNNNNDKDSSATTISESHISNTSNVHSAAWNETNQVTEGSLPSPDESPMKQEVSTPPIQRHPAFLRPYIPKSYVKESTQTPSSSSSSNPNHATKKVDEFCSNIGDMMIEPLRKLYQSAHESGQDQLKIKLRMRPIDAKFMSLVAYPYVSREQGPERLLLMREANKRGYGAVIEFVDSFLAKGEPLQTTIELQLWITCLESFQVFDNETGVLLQGSEDGLPQEVTHIVRFERTVESFGDDYYLNTDNNWKITDIDDMLGHKAWYIV